MTATCQAFHSKPSISASRPVLSGFGRIAGQRRGKQCPAICLSECGMAEWRRTYEQAQSLTRSNIKKPARLVVYQKEIGESPTRLVDYQDSGVAA